MAATTELEKIAKLADAMEQIIGVVQYYGFLVTPRRVVAVKKATNEVSGVTAKRRGRPKGSRNRAKDEITAPIEATSDIGMDADVIEEEE